MPARSVTLIYGEPATGKTTLMKKFLEYYRLPSWCEAKWGKCRYLHHVDGYLAVLGTYPEGETFGGTDKLSMSVIDDAISYIRAVDDVHVLLEGDRLANRRFIESCKAVCPVNLICLSVGKFTKDKRQAERGNKQSETWLKGRATKVANLLAAYPETQIFHNNSPAGLNHVYSRLIHMVL